MILSQLQAVANHLWQSTVFAAVAGLMTLALRKNRAATRYWLWFAASVKFLIPFSVLAMVGGHFGRQEPARIMPPIATAIERVSLPFSASSPAASFALSQPSPAPLMPTVLWSLWATGFALLLSRWWRTSRQIRAALAAASKDSLAAPIVRRISSSECAAETNAASNCDGARYTPRSSMARKKRPKRAVSLRLADS